MEQLTKRILAIVLIAVVGVGVGVTVWIFVAPYNWTYKDCPGAPENITQDQIIKVGVMGDTERIHGESALWGAELAAYEINSAGGVVVGGKTYYYGVTYENTDEANPILDITTGVAAAQRIINYKRVQLATGGFRTEALLAYRPYFMDAKVPFMNTGAATPAFCQSVLDDYETYKYFFQNNPINVSALAKELITLCMTTSGVLSNPLSPFYPGFNVTRFAFVRENLEWTAGFAGAMIAVLTNATGTNPVINMTYTGVDIAIPQDIGSTEMASHWTTLQNAKAQIVIPIISGEAGLTFTNSYGAVKPNCTLIGINVASQDGAYWDLTNGACEYGVTLESVTRTNKTSRTIAMWDAFETRYDATPIYTGVGSYDAIYQFNYAINTTQSLDPDDIIAGLEALHPPLVGNPAVTLTGAGGNTCFDDSHCTYEGWPYGVALALQWINGTKRLIPGVGIYPSDPYGGPTAKPAGSLTGMEPFRLPWWGIWDPVFP